MTGEISVVARRAHHLAPLVAAQQAGGPASAFPDLPPRAQPLAGDSGGPARARADALAAARGLRRLGVRMTLAPVADVGVAAGPVEDQVFADDARVVTRLTAAAVDGYRRGRVAAAVGHFPGEGSARRIRTSPTPRWDSRCRSGAGATCGPSPGWLAGPPSSRCRTPFTPRGTA